VLNEDDAVTTISPAPSVSSGSDPRGGIALRLLLIRIGHLLIEELQSAPLLTGSTPDHWRRDANTPLNPVAPLAVVPSSQSSHIPLALLLRSVSEEPLLLWIGVQCNVVLLTGERITGTSSTLQPGGTYEHHATTETPCHVKDGSSHFGPFLLQALRIHRPSRVSEQRRDGQSARRFSPTPL
jgi:hypothetical protein